MTGTITITSSWWAFLLLTVAFWLLLELLEFVLKESIWLMRSLWRVLRAAYHRSRNLAAGYDATPGGYETWEAWETYKLTCITQARAEDPAAWEGVDASGHRCWPKVEP